MTFLAKKLWICLVTVRGVSPLWATQDLSPAKWPKFSRNFRASGILFICKLCEKPSSTLIRSVAIATDGRHEPFPRYFESPRLSQSTPLFTMNTQSTTLNSKSQTAIFYLQGSSFHMKYNRIKVLNREGWPTFQREPWMNLGWLFKYNSLFTNYYSIIPISDNLLVTFVVWK